MSGAPSGRDSAGRRLPRTGATDDMAACGDARAAGGGQLEAAGRARMRGRAAVSQSLESYQDEIYLTGLTGAVPDLPTDLGRLEEAARSVMTPRAFDYVAGAAGSGETARENLAAFRRWRIVPRMLTDLSSPSYATTVLGANLAIPFLLAPVGVLGIAH